MTISQTNVTISQWKVLREEKIWDQGENFVFLSGKILKIEQFLEI